MSYISFIVSSIIVGMLADVANAKEIITVFIHGTMHESIRNHTCLYKSDLLLGLGLVGIDIEHWRLKEENDESDTYAAFHIINAFDLCAREIPQCMSHKRHYYTFGWSGALNKSVRKKASEQLYWALHSEYVRLSKIHPHVEIELYGHSHGNQLIFHLAQTRDVHQHHTWLVNKAVLSAAPLHYEMARYAFHPLFESVINIYSQGDMIQTMDFISMPHGACKRSFYELEQLRPQLLSSSKNIVDLRLGAYTHYNFFGHGTFFALDRYSPHPTLSRRLRHQYRQLITELYPLPLVSLYPLIISNCSKPCYNSLSANITYDQQKLQIVIGDIVVSIPQGFFIAKNYTKQKYATVGYTSELAKIFWVCKQAVMSMFCRHQTLTEA